MVKEEEIKRRFGQLPKTGQERVELEYHQMDPREFDEQMAEAKRMWCPARVLPIMGRPDLT
jgi:hypothetical protein